MTHPVIGLTGLPGSGKSTVREMLERLGAHAIDVDRVGHDVLEEETIRATVVATFGKEVLQDNNRIDRNALGTRVFTDLAALDALERIVHPPMRKRVAAQCQAHQHRQPVVIDAAVLLPMGLDALCEVVALVDASRPHRWERVRDRGWSLEELERRERRIQNGIDAGRNRITHTIENNSSIDALKRTVEVLWKEWTHASKEKYYQRKIQEQET